MIEDKLSLSIMGKIWEVKVFGIKKINYEENAGQCVKKNNS